ncbi:MAG: PAS domain S-box protein, partial [Anaerolineae bacterium]
ISDNANYGVAIADLTGDIVYANTELSTMHGYGLDELIGKNLSIFHGGARLDQVLGRSQSLQEQGSHRVEVQSTRKDGSTFPALMSGMIIKDQEGKPLFFTATMVDITQRKQMEEALRESEEHYRTLFESVPIGIGLATLDGKILAHNEAMHKMTGYSESEFEQVKLANTYQHPQERDLLLERLRADGFVQDFEVKLRRKDGTIYHASLTVTLVTLGGKDAILTMAQDITARVRADEQLRHYAAELERSNRELQQFAQIVSHDLQEPLRMVSSYLQLLERRYEGQLDQDADDFIAFAVDGATHMQDLVKDLLAYSRVGTHGRSFEPTDCQVILEQVLSNLQIALEESDATVTHDPLPVLVADGIQLVQLFQNLIGNAIKFRGERQPKIHIGVEYQGNEWLFSVRDNGIGIEARYFERIFLIFQRLHTQAEYPGTGIGLAICKRIVERHDGRMWVESDPRRGSTFYFTIPEKA